MVVVDLNLLPLAEESVQKVRFLKPQSQRKLVPKGSIPKTKH